MEVIEVTAKTFETIFNQELMFQDSEDSELCSKLKYWNSELKQHGLILNVFISNKMRYYLVDINA